MAVTVDTDGWEDQNQTILKRLPAFLRFDSEDSMVNALNLRLKGPLCFGLEILEI